MISNVSKLWWNTFRPWARDRNRQGCEILALSPCRYCLASVVEEQTCTTELYNSCASLFSSSDQFNQIITEDYILNLWMFVYSGFVLDIKFISLLPLYHQAYSAFFYTFIIHRSPWNMNIVYSTFKNVTSTAKKKKS